MFRTDPKGGTTVARNEVPWPGVDRVVLVDTPGLAEVQGEQRATMARSAARDADVVLFVVDGPLKDFESQLLAQLADMKKRVLLLLNKLDWFAPADLRLLTAQLAEQSKSVVKADDVIAKLKARNLKLEPGGTQESFKFWDPDCFLVQLNGPDYEGHVGQ